MGTGRRANKMVRIHYSRSLHTSISVRLKLAASIRLAGSHVWADVEIVANENSQFGKSCFHVELVWGHLTLVFFVERHAISFGGRA